jgi:hypothetical protein
MSKTVSVQTALELACAAQRVYGRYIKELETVYTDDGHVSELQHPNKTLINVAMGVVPWGNESNPRLLPIKLFVSEEDRTLADQIKKHFKKLMFAAIKGDNDFLTEINSLLTSDQMPASKMGFIACLPSVYDRDVSETRINRLLKECEDSYLADPGTSVKDLDAEIIQSQRSNNFDAWNICAIVDSKLVSWFSKTNLVLGPCVIIKAKVKEHRTHWKYKKSETRLNFVKAAQ